MTYLPKDLANTVEGESILLTGSAGYIGREIGKQLRINGIDFIGVDKQAGESLEGHKIDLVDSESMSRLIRDLSPDTVIHSGTHSALAYQDDFKVVFQEDFNAILTLLRNLEETPETRLIFFSSTYVYSGLNPLNAVDESTRLNPTHNFGVAKLFFEEFVLRNHPNSVVFRLSSVFGHGVQKHPNALAGMVVECQENKHLTIWGDGSRKMQYVCLEEVILSILEGITIPPGLYNLGGIEYTSVAEAAAQIAHFFNAEIEFLAEKPQGDTLPFMNTEKLRKESSARHEYPFPDALQAYLCTTPK